MVWINRLAAFMASLAEDGGPSVTRWVFMRTAEVVSIGWLILVGVVAYRYVRFGTTDPGLLTVIPVIMAALFGATTLNQNTKLTLDAKGVGSPSSISTLGGTVSEGKSDNQKGEIK